MEIEWIHTWCKWQNGIICETVRMKYTLGTRVANLLVTIVQILKKGCGKFIHKTEITVFDPFELS